MGGYGSGGCGGRPTTSDGLALSLSEFVRQKLFKPDCAWTGTLTWDGVPANSIRCEAHVGRESGRMRLTFTATRSDGEKQESESWIKLETTAQRLGGRRWWFVCPRTGRRAAKLYLPNGALTFASRQAYRLAYRSQRETTHDRALRRAFKLRGSLGAQGGIGDYVPKPKWMRWPTYDRKLEEIVSAEEVVDAHLLGFVQKLDRRLGR